MRGASRKPREPASTDSGSTDAAAIRARRPTRGPSRNSRRPSRTRRRFSPTRGPCRRRWPGRPCRGQHRCGAGCPHRLGRALAGGVAESGRELVGDARSAEPLEGVVRDDRMDDRAVGEDLAREVMVSDHDLHAGGPGGGDLLDGADSAIDGDDELGAPALDLLDARHRQAVAVGEPVGDEPVALGAEGAEGRDEDRGRGDAIDVVVAVDRDPAAGRARPRGSARTPPPFRGSRWAREPRGPRGSGGRHRPCGSRA